MITKFNNYKLITENPDTINADGEYYYCQDEGTKPFFIIPNANHTKVEQIFVGEEGSYHSEFNFSGDKYYTGRLWTIEKIVSFWVYPNEKLFNLIIKNLEKELDIKIFNNDWRIEVITSDDDGGIRRNEYDPEEDDYNLSGSEGWQKHIVPIEKYAGSEDVPEEQQIMHLMGWKEKEEARKAGKLHFPKNFGSYLTGWDSKNNIAWRQAKYQESKKY